LGVSHRLRSIVEIGFEGLGRKVSCSKTSGPILAIYTSYDVFSCNQLLLRVATIVPALIFNGVIFIKKRLIKVKFHYAS